jgi:hypothetical protein
MLLLLDECVPRPLKRDLIGHDARHVVDMGWSSKRNGELLQVMLAAQFAALLFFRASVEQIELFRKVGDPGGDRTHDPVIKSHMLYH